MAVAPVRVGLLWHSASSGNLGVGALTLANIRIARDVAASLGLALKFTIIGMEDPEQAYVRDADVDSFPLNTRRLLSPSGCWAALGRVDCLLDIGGGDSFAEIYGPKRFGFLWLSKMMAAMRGKPLLLSPQTIGPFTKPAYKALAKLVLERATAVVARDQPSYDFLRALAPRANSILATDVAFALPFEDRSGERGGERVRVGVNVSGLLLRDAETGRNRFKLDFDYAVFVRTLIRELVGRPNTEVHLFAHATSVNDASDDDGAACDRLAGEFPGTVRVPDFPGPSEAKSYLSGLDFVVAPRMHACIGAISAGVPVVPVSYSRKFTGLFGTLGYPWLIPAQGMSTDEALAFVLDGFDRRAAVQQDVTKSMANVSSLLDHYRAELSRLFSQVRK